MKIKLSVLISSQAALMMLLQEKTRREIAFSLAHNSRIITEALAPYEDFRKELITKYGEEQPGGQVGISADSPEMSKYQKEISEYIGENELVLDIKKIRSDLLPNEISGAIILDLEWMIEMPEAKSPRKKHSSAAPKPPVEA